SFLVSELSLSSGIAHSYSYYLMSAIVVASTIPILFVKERRPALNVREPLAHNQTRMARSRNKLSRLLPSSGKKILNFSIIFAFAGLGLGIIVQLMPTWYTLRFGTSETTAGLSIALAEFAGIFAIPIIPRLVKRRGTVITSVLTTVLSSIFLGLMPIAG